MWGWLTYWLSLGFSRLTGITTISSSLAVRVCRDGQWTDYGIVSRRVVTNAFVDYLVADWNGGTNVIDNFNYHGCGTGAAAEAVGETISSFLITPPAGITVNSSSETDGAVTAWVSGGTLGEHYPIKCKITTSSGRIDERTIDLTIIER